MEAKGGNTIQVLNFLYLLNWYIHSLGPSYVGH